MNARDCYLLGAAVASFDPASRTLTAGCIDNVTNNPKLAPVSLGSGLISSATIRI
jgi:hypothetical protein